MDIIFYGAAEKDLFTFDTLRKRI